MNPVERVLLDEVSRLLDRIATSVPAGPVVSPDLRARLDEAETQLAAIRASVLEGYGRWRRALEDIENLWALAAWRRAAADEAAPGEGTAQPSVCASPVASGSGSIPKAA